MEQRSDDEYRDTLNQGVQDVEALLKTFNALLSIAHAESGNYRSRQIQVNLNELLADIIELYEPLADKKNQTLTSAQHDQVSMLSSGDLLAQAFSNLIENAIKYTQDFGLIWVSVGCNDNAIEVTFTDTDPGIPANEREHVVERFVRLDSSRHTPGNGLGLSLVKAVCEVHNGTLYFDEAHPGLIVTMRFPNPH